MSAGITASVPVPVARGQDWSNYDNKDSCLPRSGVTHIGRARDLG